MSGYEGPNRRRRFTVDRVLSLGATVGMVILAVVTVWQAAHYRAQDTHEAETRAITATIADVASKLDVLIQSNNAMHQTEDSEIGELKGRLDTLEKFIARMRIGQNQSYLVDPVRPN